MKEPNQPADSLARSLSSVQGDDSGDDSDDGPSEVLGGAGTVAHPAMDGTSLRVTPTQTKSGHVAKQLGKTRRVQDEKSDEQHPQHGCDAFRVLVLFRGLPGHRVSFQGALYAPGRVTAEWCSVGQYSAS